MPHAEGDAKGRRQKADRFGEDARTLLRSGRRGRRALRFAREGVGVSCGEGGFTGGGAFAFGAERRARVIDSKILAAFAFGATDGVGTANKSEYHHEQNEVGANQQTRR